MAPKTHWASKKERGSVYGIQFLLFLYRMFGKLVFKIVLTPVMVYFYLTGRNARQAIWQFFDNLDAHQGLPKKTFLTKFVAGFKVFFSFGLAIVDKFDAWLGKVKFEDIDLIADEHYKELSSGKGGIILSGHLGNMEVCRAVFSQEDHKRPLNIITYIDHAKSFNKILKSLDPDSYISFIHIDQFGPDDSIRLKQKVENGELIVIFADRISVNNPNSANYVSFLGKDAAFPIGPFALASVMECPIFTIFCLKEKGRYKAYIEKLSDTVKVARKDRNAYFIKLTERFALQLEKYAKIAPYQWYNFFDFWQKDQNSSKK
jgi:predicted LPLAT superfamily acyltransferase